MGKETGVAYAIEFGKGVGGFIGVCFRSVSRDCVWEMMSEVKDLPLKALFSGLRGV